ncbi:hypothetical protein Hanom_Chr03g00279351 [Helianthus anomalus]
MFVRPTHHHHHHLLIFNLHPQPPTSINTLHQSTDISSTSILLKSLLYLPFNFPPFPLKFVFFNLLFLCWYSSNMIIIKKVLKMP